MSGDFNWNALEQSCLDAETTLLNMTYTDAPSQSESAYKVQKLFTIETQADKENKARNITCASDKGYTLVAVNKDLTIYNQSTNGTKTLSFESEISCFDVADGMLILIEQNGYVRIFNMSAFKEVYSTKLQFTNKSGVNNMKLNKDEFGIYDILVLNGVTVFIFENLDLNLLEELVDESTIKHVIGKMRLDKVQLTTDHDVVITDYACLNTATSRLMMFATRGQSALFCLDKQQLQKIALDCEITKIKKSFDNTFIICLNTKGCLLTIKIGSAQIHKINPSIGTIRDFAITELKCSESGKVQYTIGTLQQDEKKAAILAVFSCPSFTNVFSYSLEECAEYSLAKSQPHSDHYTVVLRGKADSHKIKIVQISEADAGTRLERLLADQNFEGALQHAENYNLDGQIIHKQIAASMLKKGCTPDQMLSILDKVADTTYIGEICLTPGIDFIETQSKLQYGLKRLGYNQNQGLYLKLQTTLQKLHCFALCFEIDDFKKNWEKFKSADCLHLIATYMEEEKFELAFKLWDCSILNTAWDHDMMGTIISVFPANLQPFSIVYPWLVSSFFPFVVWNEPESVEEIANWLLCIVGNLATDESLSESWPTNGINLIGSYLSTYREYLRLKDEIEQFNSPDQDSCIFQLKAMLQDLMDLQELKQTYNCSLESNEYNYGEKCKVIGAILDKLFKSDFSADFLKKCLHQFVKPYISKHNLVYDLCLYEFMTKVLNDSETTWWQNSDTAWKRTVSTLFYELSMDEYICLTAISVAKVAPIPWDSGIQQLTQRAMKTDSLLKEDLKHQIKLVKIKSVLTNYNPAEWTDLNDKNSGRIMLSYIIKLLNDNNMDRVIHDCLEVIQCYPRITEADMYFQIAIKLISSNCNYSDYLSLFDRIDKQSDRDLVEIVCKKIIIYCRTMVQTIFSWDLSNDDKDARLLLAASDALKCLKSKLPLVRFEEQFSNDLKLFENLRRLSESCGSHLSIDQYQKEDGKKLILKQVQENRTCSEIYWVGELLSFTNYEIAKILIVHALESNQIELLKMNFEKLMFENNSDMIGQIFTAVSSLFIELTTVRGANSDGVLQTMHFLKNLLSEAAIMCKAGDLETCIAILKPVNLARRFLNDNASQISLLSQDQFGEFLQLCETNLNVNCSEMLMLIGRAFKKSHSISNDFEANSYVDSVCILNNFLNSVQCNQSIYKLNTDALIHILVNTPSTDLNKELLSNLSSASSKNINSIMIKEFGQHELKYPYITSLLMNGSTRETAHFLSTSILRQYSADLLKVMAICDVGIEMSQRCNVARYKVQFEQLRLKTHWINVMCGFDIKIDGFLTDTSVYNIRTTLFDVLRKDKFIPISLLKKFCSSFGVEVTEILLIYLDSILHLCCYTKTDLHSINKRLVLAGDIVSFLPSDDGALYKKFFTYYNQTDSYNYELLQFLLNAMFVRNANSQQINKGLEVIQFLKRYTRISVPGSKEVEMWTLFRIGCIDKLPEIANQRLPFHMLTDGHAWDIVIPELREDTLSTWLDIADEIDLNRDEVIMNCVYNEVKMFNGKKSMRCLLEQIKDWQKCSACSAYVTSHTASGELQVEAARDAMELAYKWSTTETDTNAKQSYKSLCKLYYRLATESILKTYELGKDSILAYAEDMIPGNAELFIHTLYEHDFSGNKVATRVLDVHSAAEEIATILKLNISSIRLRLFQKWLPQNQVDLDATVSLTNFQVSVDSDYSNVSRMFYVLDKLDDETTSSYLINEIFNSDSSSLHRLKTARCLQYLIIRRNVQAQIDVGDLNSCIMSLRLMVRLDQLGVSIQIENFETSQKRVELVTSLLPRRDKEITKIIAAIFLEYSVEDRKLAEVLLNRLHDEKLMADMRKFLENMTVTLRNALWNTDVFAKCWNAAIHDLLSTKAGIANCAQASLLVHKCPIKHRLHLLELAGDFVEVGMPALALDCLGWIPDQERRRAEVEAFLNGKAAEGIRRNVEVLLNGNAPLWYLKKLEELVPVQGNDVDM